MSSSKLPLAFSPRVHLIAYALFIILIAGTFWYSAAQISSLNDQVATLTDQVGTFNSALSSTTADLRSTISETHKTLSGELNEERRNVGTIQQQLGTYQEKVGAVAGTVETLQKLSKTDPQLLQKYSKVFFLNEYYAPARFAEIPGEYEYSETKQLKLHAEVWPHLKQLLDDSKKDGVNTYVFSAYRSFNEQTALKSQYKVTYGAGSANSFSADQGYSEHQLGTTVDLITSGLGGNLDGFDSTKSYDWLLSNAYRYGFILSYPKNNGFYVFEPWHWRYVGIKLATYLHNQNINFYDMDQRKIDEYLVTVFE
jgi:LAS superfamily LD-carboxypeptidase LdcB